MLREIAGSYVVVAVGAAAKQFKGVINLNKTGATLWRLAEKGATEEEMTAALLSEYDVDPATAKADVETFINKLKETKLVK